MKKTKHKSKINDTYELIYASNFEQNNFQFTFTWLNQMMDTLLIFNSVEYI